MIGTEPALYSHNIFAQLWLFLLKSDVRQYLFLLLYICFWHGHCFVTFIKIIIIVIFFSLIYIEYRRWRCLRFLECILNTKLATYRCQRHCNVIINRFYPDALLCTFCYQFGLFNWSFLLFKIWYFFSHLNDHTGRKMSQKRHVTYLLTLNNSNTVLRCCEWGNPISSRLVCVKNQKKIFKVSKKSGTGS